MGWPDILKAIRQVLEFELLNLGGNSITVTAVLFLIIGVLITLTASRWIQAGLQRGFLARGVTDQGTIAVARRLTHYAVVLVGLTVSLQSVGVDLSVLLGAAGVAAVAIGFAMQTIAENFLAGLILLIEGAIRPGHIIEISGEPVMVKEMRIRATVVRTLDGEEIIVPNATFVKESVTNLTMTDPVIRMRVMVGVSYDSDMAKVYATLNGVAHAYSPRLESPEPGVFLRDFGASSVDWEVCVWIDDPWGKNGLSSELRRRIWDALKEAGITIAYPQLDVHLDAPVVAALSRESA